MVFINKSNENNDGRFRVQETLTLQTYFESFQIMAACWREMFKKKKKTNTCDFTESNFILFLNLYFDKITFFVLVKSILLVGRKKCINMI